MARKASLELAQLLAFRLLRHHLLKRVPKRSLLKVASDLCGVQAQLFSAAQWALGMRIKGLCAEDVNQALWKRKSLTKIWCMRGTVHLVPSRDVQLYLAALKESGLHRETRYLARRGVGERDIQQMNRAIVEALADGPLTRHELAERVGALLGPKQKRWLQHGWGDVIRPACVQGLICFGPNQGQEVTFVRLDQWLPGPKPPDAEKAKAELMRRYLKTYGPATAQDFAAWSGMTAAQTQAIFERISAEVTESHGGLLLRQDLRSLQQAALDPTNVRLLPSFDAYMLGHRNKDWVIDASYYKQVFRKAGWISPVVLIGGRACGVWSMKRSSRRLRIQIEPFRKMAKKIKQAIAVEAEALARFVDAVAEITYTS